jgi:SAM-dependent methyltransferase
MEAIDTVLELSEITGSDYLYDLGCGDGRILIAAAQRFGTRGVGIDIDPRRVREATEQAWRSGVSHLVDFRQGNLYETDFSNATVVFLYLLPHLNLRLLPALRRLKPGSRIISHDFDLGEWQPDRTIRLNTPEEPTFYQWTVGAEPSTESI